MARKLVPKRADHAAGQTYHSRTTVVHELTYAASKMLHVLFRHLFAKLPVGCGLIFRAHIKVADTHMEGHQRVAQVQKAVCNKNCRGGRQIRPKVAQSVLRFMLKMADSGYR